jgi:hypothetical protein
MALSERRVRREPAPFFCALTGAIATVDEGDLTGAAFGSGVPDGSDADAQLIAGSLHNEGGDNTNGEEGGQGRQEKGRKEALSQPGPT